MLRYCPFLIGLLLLLSAQVAPVHVQQENGCRLLCTPEVALEPSVAVEPLFRVPTVEDVETGVTTAPSPSSTFELVLAVGVSTALPRVELTGEAVWAPFAETDANPFTGRSADDLGVLEGERFLDDASPWSFTAVLVLPLAPL